MHVRIGETGIFFFESESKFIKAWENEAKEWILETGSGGKTGRSCCCHGFPGFKCPLDFRIEEQKHTHEEREVFVYSEKSTLQLQLLHNSGRNVK